MAILKCKMCGGDLNIAEGVSVCECEYCGTKQTVPTVDDEKKLTLFARANRLRFNNEFDKAAGVYEAIVADFPEEAEAYWGLVLCQYGIEYVDDPATGKKIPTCHRSSFDSVMEDNNFELTLEYADPVARGVYREEAKQIEELRRGIIAVSSKEEPYDIFICYKETDDKGERTIDSVIAQDVYTVLTEKGYRVFFSRISLEDKLGVEYEPYIFAALHSAKVMLAFGTDYNYYTAVWVKNEWSRFLQLIAKGEQKTLIPCYKGIDAYDMPKEFAKLQAQDMGKVGAMQDLVRGVEKIISAEKAVVQETVVVSNYTANVTIGSLLERVFMFLEDGDWNSTNEYCEKVLDIDPKCAEAYLGKLMAELHIHTRERLKDYAVPFNDRNNYQKAVRFGDEALKAELQGCIDHITERNRKAAYDSAVAAMENAQSEAEYATVANRLKAVGDYADAVQLAEQCREKAENIRKDAVYQQAVMYAAKQNDDSLQQAINLFASIGEWKDADARLRICQEKLKRIQETKRLRAEAKEKVAQQRAELRKKNIRKGIWALGILTVLILLWTFAIRPWISYKNGNYRIYINRYNIKEFTIPDGVTEIKYGAFKDCDNLTSITIPNSVTSIGDDAFLYCNSLTSVTIPDSVTSIGEAAFFSCESLTSITIPNSVTSIGDDAFWGCTSLTSVTIPDSVTSIGDYAFGSCTSLTSVSIPDSVTSIGVSAFHGCHSLEVIVLPDSVTDIGSWAFAYCGSLTSVTIPNSVTFIGTYAFDGCDNLTDVYFEGTIAQWKDLDVSFWHSVTVHCSDGTILDY